MYSGATLYMIGMPLLLGSWVGLLILPLILGALVARIFIEEAALRKGLPGYVDYANAGDFHIEVGQAARPRRHGEGERETTTIRALKPNLE
jgi:hypothetical protein